MVLGIVLFTIIFLLFNVNSNKDVSIDQIEKMAAQNDALIVDGLVKNKGYDIVKANCTACHSSKLVTQNRATREGWKSMIRWMQETQNLWELGDNEDIILDYLTKNYAPIYKGRRQNLANVEWYELNYSEADLSRN